MTITTISYYFYIPTALIEENNDKNLSGYVGEPNAEFDWCEANYRVTYYIVEPWNTITGLTYIFVTMILYPYYKQLTGKHNINIDNLLTLLIVLIPLGIATCLFHATLQYKHQLLDEFSMYYLISYGFATMYARCGNSNLYNVSLISSSFLCVVLWFTQRSSLILEIGRGILAISFSIYFVYIFYVGATVSSQCKDKICETLFDRCYSIWIVSIVFWWIDNVFCDLLQRDLVSFNIPYLNYHGTIWHCGSCLGIYHFFHVLLSYMLVQQYSVDIKVRSFAYIFPYITIPSKKAD